VEDAARSSRLSGTRRRDDTGFSIVVVAISMVVVAALVLLAAKETLGPTGSSNDSVSGNPEVALAESVQAQQSLSTALVAASGLGAGGGDGSIAGLGAPGAGAAADIARLSAAEPSLTFVSGPTTSATTVSVAEDPSTPSAVTLATRSAGGLCWLVWHAPGTATWYGAQTHLASCSAPALGSPPSPGPVSSTAIGWQTGSFPSA
jgi:hypothetical protein